MLSLADPLQDCMVATMTAAPDTTGSNAVGPLLPERFPLLQAVVAGVDGKCRRPLDVRQGEFGEHLVHVVVARPVLRFRSRPEAMPRRCDSRVEQCLRHRIENHLEAVFDAYRIPLDRGKVTEGNYRLDFLFLSVEAYRTAPATGSMCLATLGARSRARNAGATALALPCRRRR